MTFISSAATRRAKALPMLPRPTMPTVSPWSEPVCSPGTVPLHTPAWTWRSSVTILRFQASSSERAWLATSRTQVSGRFRTLRPSPGGAVLEDVDVIGSAGHGCLLTCTRGHAQGSITAESAMKFGIHIGHMGGPLGEMRKLWKFADARGFDWFSVSDHFQESPPRGGEMDCYEAIATLTAAAMDTTRIRLGSGVYCVAYRNPGLLAKSLTTIDHLSNGRV